MVELEIGSTADFNAFAYSPPNQNTVQFIENRLSEKMMQLGNTITDFGRQFFQQSAAAFESFHGSEAIRTAAAALRKSKAYFQSNTIRPLENLDALQTAPEVMQRFLMANPYMRDLFHRQRIDGYSNSYIDMHPKEIGPGHYDYDLVVQGQYLPDEENDFHMRYTFLDLAEGDVLLNHDQQVDILNAWELMEAMAKHRRKDGTSIYDETI